MHSTLPNSPPSTAHTTCALMHATISTLAGDSTSCYCSVWPRSTTAPTDGRAAATASRRAHLARTLAVRGLALVADALPSPEACELVCVLVRPCRRRTRDRVRPLLGARAEEATDLTQRRPIAAKPRVPCAWRARVAFMTSASNRDSSGRLCHSNLRARAASARQLSSCSAARV